MAKCSKQKKKTPKNNTHTETHTHKHTETHTETHTHTQKHTNTQKHTQKHTNTDTHRHTHTNTHIHLEAPLLTAINSTKISELNNSAMWTFYWRDAVVSAVRIASDYLMCIGDSHMSSLR